MKQSITFLLIVLVSFFVVNSCSLFSDEDNFQDYDNLREITHWTVDTLDYSSAEDMYLRTFWGSSADNLYIVGYSSEGLIGAVWHYDGNEWSPVPLHTYQGGEIDGLVWVEDIWGFGKNDVYIVGVKWTHDDDLGTIDSSFVVHYNGSEWKEIKVDNFGMNSIGGTGPDDIWLGGWTRGNLSHWNGNNWKNYNDVFPEGLYYGIPSFEDITQSKYNTIYAIFNNYNDFPYLVSTKGTEWKIEHLFDEVHYYKLDLSENGTLYTYGLGEIPISIWNNGDWQPFFIEENFLVTSIYNLDDDNLLITGSVENEWKDDQNITHYNYDRKIFHYNGTDFFSLKEHDLSDTPYGIWSDGKEIFVASSAFIYPDGIPQHKTTIIHGR